MNFVGNGSRERMDKPEKTTIFYYLLRTGAESALQTDETDNNLEKKGGFRKDARY